MSLIHCVQNYILRLYDEDATWPPCTRCYDCTSPTTNWQLWAGPKKIIVVQPLSARRGAPAWQASKHCPGASALSAVSEVAVVHQLLKISTRLVLLPPRAQRLPLPHLLVC